MKITAVSQQCGLTADTLRYYEKIGLIPPIRRSTSGIRDYTVEDVKHVEFVKCLRAAGVPIEALLAFFRLDGLGNDTALARKSILVDQRERLERQLEEMQATLELLNYKIEYYDRLSQEVEVERDPISNN